MLIQQTEQSYIAAYKKRSYTLFLCCSLLITITFYPPSDTPAIFRALTAGAFVAPLLLLGLFFLYKAKAPVSGGKLKSLEFDDTKVRLFTERRSLVSCDLSKISKVKVKWPYLLLKKGLLSETKIVIDIFERDDAQQFAEKLGNTISQNQ